MTSLWDSQRWHPIETSTRFVMNENGKCIRNPILVLPQKSLHPPHERFRPAVHMLLEHACIPRILKPTEVVPLCWGQALAEAGESIQDFPSALLRSDSTAATADPFRVGVRAATTAAPLYVHASIRVGSATADQIVPLHKICAVRADVHSRPPARVQWYIGPVAQRSCVAAFELVRVLALALALA